MRSVRTTVAGIFLLASVASAQEKAPRIYKDRIAPHWSANNSKFWYENELPGGVKEYIVVDAQRGGRERVEEPPSDQAASEPNDKSDDRAEEPRRWRENA